MPSGKPDPAEEAARLAAQAAQHEAAGEHEKAWQCYRASLALHPDATVQAALQRLLATIGPQ